MRILQTTPYYPPHVGGIEFHVKGLVDGLSERGHDVEIASSCGKGCHGFNLVPCINLMYFPLPVKFPRPEADIYHSHVPSPTLAYFLRDASPHIVTYHNDVALPRKINGLRLPWPLVFPVEWANKKLLEPVLERADIIIATTKSYAETSSMLKEHLHKVKIVPNAVDASLYKPEDNKDPYVIYVGRLVEYKGVDTLLKAMREVQRWENLRLMIVGDGYDRQRFESMARRMGVNVDFTGRVERARLIDLVSRAEMLVLPTANRLEAFGIVLLEAMACKTPVVAFDTPGVSDVAREGGVVFSDVSELTEMIMELHRDETRRRLLGERGRRAVKEKYSWAKVLDDIESIYSEFA